jgi:hypothetical protein
MNVLNLEKMEAKLIKTPEQLYKLEFYNDKNMLACATALLSKQNCDEIFGDVDDLAYKHRRAYQDSFEGMNECIMKDAMHQQVGFVAGFNKAMELYQPTEIEVEIERQCLDPNCDGVNRKGCCIPGDKPKLDSEGCLIIKKK